MWYTWRHLVWERRVFRERFVDFSSLFNYDRTNVSDELFSVLSVFFSPRETHNFYYTHNVRRECFRNILLRRWYSSLTISRHMLIGVFGETPSCRKLPRELRPAVSRENDEIRHQLSEKVVKCGIQWGNKQQNIDGGNENIYMSHVQWTFVSVFLIKAICLGAHPNWVTEVIVISLEPLIHLIHFV